MAQQFNTDLEGPFTRDDNAFDLAGYFIPKGSDFFTKISAYDDYLADIAKKPGYNAGNTLKLIVPFLIAYGADSKEMKKFSSEHIHMLLGSKETLQYIQKIMRAFIISTSYKPYVSAVCDVTGFPLDNCYCTELNIGGYKIDKEEVGILKRYVEEINKLPEIVLLDRAKSKNDLSDNTKKTIGRLDEIFWEKLPSMEAGRVIENIVPIGGKEKAKAIEESLGITGNDLKEVVYFGDSITDVEAFQLVNRGSGLTISINGNKYAVKNASVGCMTYNTIIISVLADIFKNAGTEEVKEVAENWGVDKLELEVKRGALDRNLFRKLCSVYPEELSEVVLLNSKNIDDFVERSSLYRKSVRGESVGALG